MLQGACQVEASVDVRWINTPFPNRDGFLTVAAPKTKGPVISINIQLPALLNGKDLFSVVVFFDMFQRE